MTGRSLGRSGVDAKRFRIRTSPRSDSLVDSGTWLLAMRFPPGVPISILPPLATSAESSFPFNFPVVASPRADPGGIAQL